MRSTFRRVDVLEAGALRARNTEPGVTSSARLARFRIPVASNIINFGGGGEV